MAGIDNIIQQIRQESMDTVRQMEADARTQADAIQKSCDAACQEILKDAQQARQAQAARLLEKEHSRILMEEKNADLALKQQIIEETMQAAVQKLCTLEGEAYFRLIMHMVRQFAQAADGIIYFSEKDHRRFPKDFQKSLDGVSQAAGGHLTIAEECRPVDGGFILAYGGVEINGSFSALFWSREEELRDLLNGYLFEERTEGGGT